MSNDCREMLSDCDDQVRWQEERLRELEAADPWTRITADPTSLPPDLTRVWVTHASGKVLECQVIKGQVYTYRTGLEVTNAIAWTRYQPAPYNEVNE
jgi:hypothetical protein